MRQLLCVKCICFIFSILLYFVSFLKANIKTDLNMKINKNINMTWNCFGNIYVIVMA